MPWEVSDVREKLILEQVIYCMYVSVTVCMHAFFFFLSLVFMYVYMYICVCVCVCNRTLASNTISAFF